MDVLLKDVAHVPGLRYHLFSLPTLIKNGHAFDGSPTGVSVRLEYLHSIVFPLSGTLFSLYGYRVDSSSRETACAVLAPGQPPNKFQININFHCASGHAHEVLLRKTAEQQGIVLEGELLECKGCFNPKGLRKGE